MRVLVVCHGNINRSPVAAAIMRRVTAWEVRSAALGGRHPRRATRRAREYATQIGLDLGDHRSVLVTCEDIEWSDIVVYMDRGNLRRLQRLGVSLTKMECLATVLGEKRIPDPHFMNDAGAALSFKLLEMAALQFCVSHDADQVPLDVER